ncbi:MAG: hypothetical protein P8Y97_23350 [Candidatus Lokiarchaeota archaeon]
MGLWKTIAKNEIKRRTSKVRKHRLTFFAIIYAGIMIWAFVLAPLLFDSFMPTLTESETIKPFIVPAIALIIEYIFMILFLIIMLYPMNYVFRQTEIGHKEMILAAPITPGDIFFGEFIGRLPFTFIYVFAVAPAITGLINPLVNLTFFQSLIIYIVVFGMCVFALLLGSIISSFMEHKIANSEKTKDIGKALLMIISIGMVALIYSLEFFFNYLMQHPEIRNWLAFYPAQWFSNIIVFILEPSLLNSYILNIWASLILVIFVPLLVFYLSYKKADAFYSLEGGVDKSSTVIESESNFYGFFRKILGHKWEGLVIVQLKDFFRKKENITKIGYVSALMVFFGVVYPFVMPGGGSSSFISSLVLLIMRIYMGGLMLSIIFGGFIFVGSKDLLWVYKKSPKGVNGLVFSYLIMLSILIFVLDLGLTILLIFFFKFSITEIIISFVAFFVSAFFALLITVGIQCFRPAFEEKGKTMGGNMFLTIIIQIGIFLGFIFLIAALFSNFPSGEWFFFNLFFKFNFYAKKPSLK